jgi:hypothetical protein
MQIVDLSSPALFPAAMSTMPANIQAPSSLVGLMRDMWIASPTFRRQCARIAGATGTRVAVVIRRPRSPEVRATSMIEHRRANKWDAVVEVNIDGDLVEMIAHEFEHVIEQLDGVDLVRLAQQGVDGVMSGSSDRYETARAVATGKRVAREYRNRERETS